MMKGQRRFGVPHQLGYFASELAIGNSDSRKVGIHRKIDCHCTFSCRLRDGSARAMFPDRLPSLDGEACASGVSLKTKPTPRMLRIMGASFDPSTLRRSRPI